MQFRIYFAGQDLIARLVDVETVEANVEGPTQWKPVLPGYRLQQLLDLDDWAWLAIPDF